MKIANHLWIVTGAASGLGLATATLLSSLGGQVALFDLNEDKGQELARTLGKDKADFFHCDVGDEESVKEAIKRARDRFKGVKWGGVVHAGGVGMAGKTIDRDGQPFNLETFQEVHRINLTGSFLMASNVASEIAKQGASKVDLSKPENAQEEGDKGVIILTSSVSATEGQMGQVAYASSKAAVEGLVLPMARDLGRYGIRVVCIAPSLFSTNMGANTSDKTRQSLLATTLFPPRFGVPQEFAKLAQAVIENGYLNGTVIRIDGGGRMAKM
ncbi:hypothetical protein JCM10212_001108 [Sporobolomyces blumeae]